MAVILILLVALGGGGFYAFQSGMLGQADEIRYREATIRLSGDELDIYRGASLHMDLDTASGYRRAIQGFETLAEEMNGWYSTDQEIILSKLILSYARLSDIQSADTGLNKALELSDAYLSERPDSLYLLLADAETRIRAGQTERAQENLSRFDQTIESFYLYHYIQGLRRLSNHDIDLAIVSLRRSNELADDFTRGHFELGRAYEASRRQSDAVAAYETVVRYSPNHAPAHYQLALIALSRDEVDAAIKHAETATAVDESHLHAQALLARLQLQQDNHSTARRHADNVLDLARPGRHDDLLVTAHKIRGELALAADDASDAQRQFELALQIAPGDGEAADGLAKAERMRQEQQAAARPAATQPAPAPRQREATPQPSPAPSSAEPSAEKQAPAALEEARTYYRRGMLRNAAEHLQQAVRHAPDNDEAWTLLGQIYIEVDRQEQALRALQRAISLNPQNADAHVNLGGLYDAMGETSRATQAYRRYLELAPEGSYANDIRAVLAGRE